MKKWLILISILLLCPATVLAAESGRYETAEDLLYAWKEADSLPDYISGFWLENEVFHFGIVDDENKENNKQKVLALIEDRDSVVFTYQKYSFNYLNSLFENFHVYFEEDVGLLILDADEHRNCVSVVFSDEYIDNPETQALISSLTSEYGDVLHIEYMDPDAIQFVHLIVSAPPSFQYLQWTPPYMRPSQTVPARQPILIAAFAIAMCAAMALVAVNVAHRRKVLLHGRGANISATRTVEDVERQIKQTVAVPSPALDDRVMATIAGQNGE